MKRKQIKFEDFKLDDRVINSEVFYQFVYNTENYNIILKYIAPFAHWNNHRWELTLSSKEIGSSIFDVNFESYSQIKESPDKVINMLNDNLEYIMNIFDNIKKNETI